MIFDISSDEEPARDDPKVDYTDWLSEILYEVEKELEVSDEVVVVGEVNPTKQQKLKSSKRTVDNVAVVCDDGDDDCVVLDGDPDKQVAVINDITDDSNELLIVGQKGQIACRDYPHPRHDCAKFPFSSTPHERHCNMCHCYVCDCLAPCVHWGTGSSSVDHCNATDKERLWKIQRENFRLLKSSALPVPKVSDSLVSVAPQVNQDTARNIVRLMPESTAHNQVSRPSTVRACSSSTRVRNSNNRDQVRSRQVGFVMNKNGFQQRPVPQHLLGVHNNAIQKDRHLNYRSLMVSSNKTPRRSVAVGDASIFKIRGYGSSSHSNVAQASQHTQSPVAHATSNDTNITVMQDVCSSINLETHTNQSSLPSLGSFTTSTPSQPQEYCQPITLSDNDPNINCLRNQNQDIPHQSILDYEFDFDMPNHSSQIYEQPPAENFHPQNTGPTNELLVEFEDWLLDNNSVPLVTDSSGSDPVTFDAGWF